MDGTGHFSVVLSRLSPPCSDNFREGRVPDVGPKSAMPKSLVRELFATESRPDDDASVGVGGLVKTHDVRVR